MKTLRDLLDMPLPELGSLLKNFLEAADHRLSVNSGEPTSTEVETTESEEEPEEKLPEDLVIVLDLNKAIAEKYQATGHESLLKHIATQLANERECEREDVIEEVRVALHVEPEKRELLKMDELDRIEFIAEKTTKENSDLVDKIIAGDKDAMVKLDSKNVENALGTAEETDLKFALRSELKKIMKDKSK